MHAGMAQAKQYEGRVEVVEVSGFIAQCLAAPPLQPSRSMLGPPGTCTWCRAPALCSRSLHRFAAADGWACQGICLENDDMKPRRSSKVAGASGASARPCSRRACTHRMVDAHAGRGRSVRGSAARLLRPGALPLIFRQCTQPVFIFCSTALGGRQKIHSIARVNMTVPSLSAALPRSRKAAHVSEWGTGCARRG